MKVTAIERKRLDEMFGIEHPGIRTTFGDFQEDKITSEAIEATITVNELAPDLTRLGEESSGPGKETVLKSEEA